MGHACRLEPVLGVQLSPITLHPSNYCGDMTFDGNCDLLVGGCIGNGIYRISHTTGAVTSLATSLANARGVAYRSTDGLVYTSDADEIYVLNPSPTLVVNLGNYITSIAVAPAGWGSYGGRIVAAQYDGDVYAVNPTGPVSTLVGTLAGAQLSDLAFASDGNLYVVRYDQGQLLSVTPAGVFAVVATGLGNPTGLASDPLGARLFVADDGAGRVWQVALPAGTATQVGTGVFDSGWAVSGLARDGAGHLLMMVGCSGGGACVNSLTVP